MREEEFEQLYDEHAQGLFAFLAYRTGDRALAEDLVADTFERAFRARSRFDRRRAQPKTWLYAIALNLLRDSARRARTEGEAMRRAAADVVDHQAGPGGHVADRDLVARMLTALNDGEREAIALRYGAQLTVSEIAKLLALPATTVETRVYRALGKLRREVGAPQVV
jgi:RNA polymerase sigma-70 factor (ECF subfamily)